MRFIATRVALILLAALAFAGCRGREESKPRVVLIGLDGASWKLIEPMAKAGEKGMPGEKGMGEKGMAKDAQAMAGSQALSREIA